MTAFTSPPNNCWSLFETAVLLLKDDHAGGGTTSDEALAIHCGFGGACHPCRRRHHFFRVIIGFAIRNGIRKELFQLGAGQIISTHQPLGGELCRTGWREVIPRVLARKHVLSAVVIGSIVLGAGLILLAMRQSAPRPPRRWETKREEQEIGTDDTRKCCQCIFCLLVLDVSSWGINQRYRRS